MGLFGPTRRRSGATRVVRATAPRATQSAAEHKSGAPPVRLGLGRFMLAHWQAGIATLAQLSRAPIATAMTAAVIGIALALPAGFYVVLNLVQGHSAQWQDERQISVYLKPEIMEAQASVLADRLRALPGVRHVKLITQVQALAEMRRQSGFAEALALLDENPLPVALVVYPAVEQELSAVNALLTQLRGLPEAESVQFDMQWLQRLQAMLRLAERGVLLLAGLLSLGVLLIIANTLRLAIQNRREEIEIIKLIGATNAFIRRPFLYLGLGYGLLGGLTAWALVSLALALLHDPVAQLSKLYGSDFQLIRLTLSDSVLLLSLGGALGLLGALLAIHRHLAAIEPT